MNLTTLARVRQYAPIAAVSTNVDPLVRSLIAAESRSIMRYIGTAVGLETLADIVLDGTGTSRIMLPRTPVISVSALRVSGLIIPAAATAQATGYLLDGDFITMTLGVRFPNCRSAALCSWQAGYVGSDSQVIPAGNTPVTITPSPDTCEDGMITGATSVVVDGVTFTAATTANAPLAGEYGLVDGVFEFNGTDGGKTAVMTYVFVPGPIVLACNEMVALDLQQRNNPGIKSKGLANESVVYDSTSMTPSIKAMLSPYRRMSPTA